MVFKLKVEVVWSCEELQGDGLSPFTFSYFRLERIITEAYKQGSLEPL